MQMRAARKAKRAALIDKIGDSDIMPRQGSSRVGNALSLVNKIYGMKQESGGTTTPPTYTDYNDYRG